MLWVWGQQGTRLLLGPEPMHQWEVTATQLKTGLINAQVLNHRLQAANHTWGSTQSTKLQEERLKPPCVSWEVAANCIHDTSSRKRSVQPLHTETWLSSTSLINHKTNKQQKKTANKSLKLFFNVKDDKNQIHEFILLHDSLFSSDSELLSESEL